MHSICEHSLNCYLRCLSVILHLMKYFILKVYIYMHVELGRFSDMYAHKCVWICGWRERTKKVFLKRWPKRNKANTIAGSLSSVFHLVAFPYSDFSNQHPLPLKTRTVDISRRILDLIQDFDLIQFHLFFSSENACQLLFETMIYVKSN